MNEDETARLYIEHGWPYGLGATPVTVGAGTAANDNDIWTKEASKLKKWETTIDFRLKCLPFGITYLASPYSLYKHGFHMAARHASRAAAALMNKGLVVYAPISHGHAIACDNDLPTTWEFWKGQCQPSIDAASACVVLKLDGWEESVGVEYEIEEFERQGKPVVYVTMDDLALPCSATVEEEVRMRRVA